MPPLAASRSRQPGLPLKNRKAHAMAEDSHGHDEKAPDIEDAESIHSDSTQELGPEGLLRQAEDARDRIIELGGKPTRPIAEYSRDVETKRLLLMPANPTSRRTDDEEYYRHYCYMEMCFFNEELRAWQSFMKWFRRKWVQQNDAAGGSLPPPPPVLEIDPLDLHTQYLGFMLLVRKEDEKADIVRRMWDFGSYGRFLEHIAAVRGQVAELREKQGPEDDTRFRERLGYCGQVLANWGLGNPAGFQEQLKVVAEDLATIQSRTIINRQAPEAAPFEGFFQLFQGGAEPQAQPNGANRKRAREAGPAVPDPAAKRTKTEVQADTAPATNKTKLRGSGLLLDHTPTAKAPPKEPRGKSNRKTHDDGANARLSESKHEVDEPSGEVNPDPKPRGRPPKRSQPTSVLGTATQGKTRSNQKRRGGPHDKAQSLGRRGKGSANADNRQRVEKKAAVARVRNNTQTVSDSGLRRSLRIAAKATINTFK